MSPSGIFLTVLALVTLALVGVVFAAFLRHTPRPRAAQALSSGDFEAALSAAAGARSALDLLPAATAARHLGDFEAALQLAGKALADDPRDGEAWIEKALACGYTGDFGEAAKALDRAASLRADLLESINLHRAWIALRAADRDAARRLFDEVEAPLETKLRTDLGSGEAVFADWFLQAGELWGAFGDADRAAWAMREARRSAPRSRLH